MIIGTILTFALMNSLTAQAGRILVAIPTPSISHQVVFRPLTQELARRGHELVIITADPAFPKGKAPENITEIDVHDLSYKIWTEMIVKANTLKNYDLATQMGMLLPAFTKIFEEQMKTEEVQSLINDKKNHFDLLIIEACATAAIGLAHVFKAPVILASSFLGVGDNYEIVGAPTNPLLLYPTVLSQKLVNLSLREKLNELYQHYLFKSVFDDSIANDDRALKRIFGPDTPSTTELKKRVDMLFVNVHPTWDFNRPVPPSVLYMGGLHQKPPKELPAELKSYLDSSKHGVIYISFGTNVIPSQLPPEKIQVLVKTFSQLPYDVLWKWDKDELPGRSSNIRISKWLPQSDLLKHPNVKLFVTQGGLQSTDEAITAGVPLIGMPMLVDQWYNVEMYLHHKIGLRLDLEIITEENFSAAIEKIINDKSYCQNIERLRSVMLDQPQPPLERAVWWTEHVMRHGGASHLRARTANMTWAEYLDLQLLTFFAVTALILLIAMGLAVYLLIIIASNILSGAKSKSKTN